MQYVISTHMNVNFLRNNSLKNFAGYTCQRDRPIIF